MSRLQTIRKTLHHGRSCQHTSRQDDTASNLEVVNGLEKVGLSGEAMDTAQIGGDGTTAVESDWSVAKDQVVFTSQQERGLEQVVLLEHAEDGG